MNTYTHEDLMKLAAVADSHLCPGEEAMTAAMISSLETEPTPQEAMVCFLSGHIGGPSYSEVIQAVYDEPKEAMPCYLASNLLALRIVGEWRLSLGR